MSHFIVKKPDQYYLIQMIKFNIIVINSVDSTYLYNENGTLPLWSSSPKKHNSSLIMKKKIRQISVEGHPYTVANLLHGTCWIASLCKHTQNVPVNHYLECRDPILLYFHQAECEKNAKNALFSAEGQGLHRWPKANVSFVMKCPSGRS